MKKILVLEDYHQDIILRVGHQVEGELGHINSYFAFTLIRSIGELGRIFRLDMQEVHPGIKYDAIILDNSVDDGSILHTAMPSIIRDRYPYMPIAFNTGTPEPFGPLADSIKAEILSKDDISTLAAFFKKIAAS